MTGGAKLRNGGICPPVTMLKKALRVTQPEGLEHSPALQVKLVKKGHPRGRASFHGLLSVGISFCFTVNSRCADRKNCEQAASCMQSVLLLLSLLTAVLQCYSLLSSTLMAQRHLLSRMAFITSTHYSVALARQRYRQRTFVRRRRFRKMPGRNEQWRRNRLEGILPDTELRKNSGIDRDIFMKIANDLRPYLRPRRSPRGKDMLSVEKQLFFYTYKKLH